MPLTASVLLDLRDLDEMAARRRCSMLRAIPDGARLVVVVGPLAPMFDAAHLLSEHADRLHIELQGEPYAIPQWVEALQGKALLG